MIPDWMPGRLFQAYATGVAHASAGLAIVAGAVVAGLARNGAGIVLVTGALARLAAAMLTVMLGLFTLLVHVTGVMSDPGSRLQWTMLGVATSLTGAAWIVSTALPETRAGEAVLLREEG